MRHWLLPLAAVLVVGGLWVVFRGLPEAPDQPSAPEAGAPAQPAPGAAAPDERETLDTPGTGAADDEPPVTPQEPSKGGPVEEQFERATLPKVALTEAVQVGGRERPRTHYLDARVLVELDARKGSRRTGQPPVVGARLVAESGAQRRWYLPAGTGALEAHAALAPAAQASHSVVLHGAPATNSPGRIPVALLRVKFPPEWAPREAERFAELHDLEGLQKLTIEPNWFSFRATSGPAALAKARSLRANADVLAAEPDWWRPLRVR